MINQSELEKHEALEEYIQGLGSVAVGFSGGVDSTFLVTVAKEVLGDRAVAVTCKDASVPERELQAAKAYCRERGIRHIVTTVNPLAEEGYRNNSPNRCYYCKKCVFSEVGRVAKELGIRYLAEGSNMDDLGDYRPGLTAVAELGVTSPLREAGLYKEEIRHLSQHLEIPTYDKPAFACLASRFVYGEEITEEKLSHVDQAEDFLIGLGFRNLRVRVHGDLARIEVPEDEIGKLTENGLRTLIERRLTEIGFRYVTADLRGYRAGSMNEALRSLPEGESGN